jgi:hypothetical protein
MNEKEKNVVTKMITIYCRSKHKSGKGLCEECEILNAYAMQRLERCMFGEEKPTCGSCTIHCYKKDMRERIRIVMRFAGARMFFIHPIVTVKHMIRERKLNKEFTAN